MKDNEVGVEEMDDGQLKVTINALRIKTLSLEAELANSRADAQVNHWKGFWSGMLMMFGVMVIGGLIMPSRRRRNGLMNGPGGSIPVIIVEKGPALSSSPVKPAAESVKSS